MSDLLEITTAVSGEGWDITASVISSTSLPRDIFVYENSGTSALGPYIGVCNMSEMTRIQIWSGSPLVKFGNRFVRTNQAKIQVPLLVDPSTVVTNMVASAKSLKLEITAAASKTTVYPI